MTEHIKVSQEDFDAMNKCGDWDSTTAVLIEAIGFVPAAIYDQEVNPNRSYQDDQMAVIVGARTSNTLIITIKK